SSDATLNFHIAAGEYSQSFNVASQTLKDGTTARRINVICGYPSTITIANAASNPPDPDNNDTVFSGSELSSGTSVWKCTKTNTFLFSGMTVSGYAGNDTNDVAFTLHEDSDQTLQATFVDCQFLDNDNTGGTNNVGAAVSVYYGAEASFTRCAFSGNLASAGAALNMDSNAVVAMTDCTFTGNKVSVHQANNAQDCGGAIKIFNGILTLNNCTLSSNGVEAATIGYGGALWMDQSETTTVTVNGGSFESNYVANATGKGGAIFLQGGTLNLNDVTFSANACSAAAMTTGGGAVFIGYDSYKSGRNVTLNVTGCEFDGNILADRGDDKNSSVGGGAFYIEPDAGKTVTCSFTGTTFSNHILNDIYGGVFYAKGGTLRFYGCTFTGNDIRWTYAKANPGSLQRQAVGSVVYNEGAVCYFDDDASGRKTVFTSNAGYKGGCLCIDSSTSASYTLDDCIFQENITTASGGSCVRVGADNGQVLTIHNCTFSDNESASSGGAVAVYKNNETTISGCTFEDNTSEGFGGAVYIAGETSFAVATVAPVTISDCTFNRNVANGGGGAIEVSNAGCDDAERTEICNSDVDILRCSFTGNNSGAYGGAVGIRTFGTTLIKDCSFTENFTRTESNVGKGGALSFRDGNKQAGLTAHATVSGCTFIGNYTPAVEGADGGAIQVNAYAPDISGTGVGVSDASMDFRMDKCVFYNNYAYRGGALRFNCSPTGTYSYYINDCVFEKNHISCDYGTTIRADGGYLCMNNCTIHDTWTEKLSSTGRWACWVDVMNVAGVFSNNTLIGQTQHSSGDTGESSKNTGGNFRSALFRLDFYSSASYNLYFINNIFAPTQDWVYSIIQNRPDGGTKFDLGTYFYANKMGPTVPYVDESTTNGVVAITNDAADDGLNSFNFKGTSSYFGDLAWNTGSPVSLSNTYWYWNGVAATGSPTGMISIASLASRIKDADSDFYDWLNTDGIDGIYKDQRGAIRTSPVATGAYDPGNAGHVSDDTAEDANRSEVTLTN
ncbi:MAG: hypothetical protein IJU13_07005, partial [Bacteroidales bacterium]|nr:hypothetical protein [Bacteroidales bacterium]